MMLEEFTKEQITFTASILPSDAFLYILEACEQGLGSSLVLKHACSAITSICTFAIQDKEEKWFLSLLNSFPHVLPRLLTTVFGFILFDDNNDQWQLSRPLYTLVLLQRDVSCLKKTADF
jgi:exportin-7